MENAGIAISKYMTIHVLVALNKSTAGHILVIHVDPNLNMFTVFCHVMHQNSLKQIIVTVHVEILLYYYIKFTNIERSWIE